jgi:hypothetical protein
LLCNGDFVELLDFATLLLPGMLAALPLLEQVEHSDRAIRFDDCQATALDFGGQLLRLPGQVLFVGSQDHLVTLRLKQSIYVELLGVERGALQFAQIGLLNCQLAALFIEHLLRTIRVGQRGALLVAVHRSQLS